ncbi:hypothetical protein [Blautia producta]|uniref:hypothetical protein n=1 Tax=Blautia producta TaxID=33035 RepID=UPI0035677AD2
MIDEWREKRYKLFNEKIEAFKNHPKYGWLREYADEAIIWNEGFGFLMIKAADFIERIEKMPHEYINDWLEGKNQLEWKPEFIK